MAFNTWIKKKFALYFSGLSRIVVREQPRLGHLLAYPGPCRLAVNGNGNGCLAVILIFYTSTDLEVLRPMAGDKQPLAFDRFCSTPLQDRNL